jgi:hypothetical protein
MSPKEPFANAVSKQGALWRLLSVLERPDPIETQTTAESSGTEDREIIRRKVKGWALMESLSSSPSVATKMIESSCWLELLGILVGYAKFSRMWAARLGAAKTLSRLMWDPQTGPSTGMTRQMQDGCLPVSGRPDNLIGLLSSLHSAASATISTFDAGCPAEGRGTRCDA